MVLFNVRSDIISCAVIPFVRLKINHHITCFILRYNFLDFYGILIHYCDSLRGVDNRDIMHIGYVCNRSMVLETEVGFLTPLHLGCSLSFCQPFEETMYNV